MALTPPPFPMPPPGYQPYAPHQPGSALPLAGFGDRLGGWLLDSLLYGLLGGAIAIPGIVFVLTSSEACRQTLSGACPAGEPDAAMLALGIALIVSAAVIVCVVYIRALATTGQTWGSKAVGIKVVGKRTGEPIGVGGAIGRQLFAWFISGQLFYIGYLWMLWDDDNQTLQDKVVGSIVVRV